MPEVIADNSNSGSCAPEINELFLRNMGALWETDPRTAQRIDDLPLDAGVQTAETRSGAVTARVQTHDQRTVYLHSRYDPIKEAAKFAEGADVEGKSCLLVCGLGLGYHVRELFGRMHDEAVMVVIEPDLALIKTALEHVDLSCVLGSARCFFLCDLDKNRIHERMNSFGARTMLGTQYVTHPASEQASGPFFQAMRATLADYLAYSKMSLQTLVHNARITNTNVAHNLAAYVSTPPIDVVKNRFAGYPAIIVAAGPSLVRNIDELPNAKGRAVLITVQTTFKTLLAKGITPDFVTSLDYAEISRRFFEGVEHFGDAHLIAEPKAHCGTIDAFHGAVSILHNDFAQLCLGRELGAREGLKAGATVAHLAFYLAEYLGCDPVAFVGQDLAFSDGVFYTPGVEVHASWRPELNRFYSMESKEWERVVRHRKHLRPIQDVHGRDVYTDEQLFSYLQQFEGDFAGSPVTVIDATQGGARKAHTTPMNLSRFINQCCCQRIPAANFAYRQEVQWRDASRLPSAREQVGQRIDELISFEALCRDMLELLHELKNHTDNPAKFNRLIVRVDEMRTAVQRRERIYEMVTMVAQMAEYRRFAADHKLSGDKTTGAKRTLRQLERDVDFVQALRDGCDETLEILKSAASRIDLAIAGGQT